MKKQILAANTHSNLAASIIKNWDSLESVVDTFGSYFRQHSSRDIAKMFSGEVLTQMEISIAQANQAISELNNIISEEDFTSEDW